MPSSWGQWAGGYAAALLDVVPLFESADALETAGPILDALLAGARESTEAGNAGRIKEGAGIGLSVKQQPIISLKY